MHPPKVEAGVLIIPSWQALHEAFAEEVKNPSEAELALEKVENSNA